MKLVMTGVVTSGSTVFDGPVYLSGVNEFHGHVVIIGTLNVEDGAKVDFHAPVDFSTEKDFDWPSLGKHFEMAKALKDIHAALQERPLNLVKLEDCREHIRVLLGL